MPIVVSEVIWGFWRKSADNVKAFPFRTGRNKGNMWSLDPLRVLGRGLVSTGASLFDCLAISAAACCRAVSSSLSMISSICWAAAPSLARSASEAMDHP